MPTIGNPHVLFALLLLTANARGEVEIPVVGRPTTFSGAAGSPVTIEAKAESTELTIDQAISFTIVVRNLAKAAEMTRPTLVDMPGWQRDFQIENDGEGEATPGTRTFRYKLLVRRATVDEIPALTLSYYDPRVPQPPDQPGLSFRTARTTAIALRIRTMQSTPRDVVPLDVPPFAEHLGLDAFQASRQVWWLAILAPPILTALYTMFMWYAFPAGRRLARRRRSRAATSALRRLPRANAEQIVALVGSYLIARFDLPTRPRTASEFAEAMSDQPIRHACDDFFHFADAARFAPASTSVNDLADRARQLIQRCEGEA